MLYLLTYPPYILHLSISCLSSSICSRCNRHVVVCAQHPVVAMGMAALNAWVGADNGG